MLNSKDGHGVIYQDLSDEDKAQEKLSNGPLWQEYLDHLEYLESLEYEVI